MWVTRVRHIEIDVLRGYFRPGFGLLSANSPDLPDSRCGPRMNIVVKLRPALST